MPEFEQMPRCFLCGKPSDPVLPWMITKGRERLDAGLCVECASGQLITGITEARERGIRFVMTLDIGPEVSA